VERDPGALCRLARDLHFAAVQQRNALHDRQPQAGAAGMLGTRGVDAEEAIKNPGQSFGWNTDAGIGDFDANRGSRFEESRFEKSRLEKSCFETSVFATSALVLNTTAPPGGVWARAFETRLPTALCRSVRSSSAMTGSRPTVVVSEIPPSAAEAS